MLNSEPNDEMAFRFARRKLAKDDEFCTGADFIQQKYVSFGFQFLLVKFNNFRF
jgi:hypothetical protein